MAKKLQATAAVLIPTRPTLKSLRQAAASCTACDLYKKATQTVFGEGPSSAKIMFVGEQPGDEEDKAGHPFVGPAGRLLEKALAEAKIDRTQTYVTNVVKHFKWVPRGKRRIHEKPNVAEVTACVPWLLAEIEQVDPKLLVCLGATAAQALLGRDFRVTKDRGKVIPTLLRVPVMATIHPSAILRARDDERQSELERFIQDLRVVAKTVKGTA